MSARETQHTLPWVGPLSVSSSGAIIDARGMPVVYATGVHAGEAAALVAAVNQSAAAPALLAACEMAQAEAVTLKSRLPEPYASNMAKLADACQAAIAAARGERGAS